MRYTVRIDPDVCMSTGNCVRRAPAAFAFDDDDVAVPQPAASDLSDDELLQIARGCPVGAILLFTEDGSEVDPYGT